jgi:hypothetical protein
VLNDSRGCAADSLIFTFTAALSCLAKHRFSMLPSSGAHPVVRAVVLQRGTFS